MARDVPQAAEANQLSRGWNQSTFQHSKIASMCFFVPLLTMYILYTQTKQQLNICNLRSSYQVNPHSFAGTDHCYGRPC